jgi:hypothetical protein
MLGVDQMTKKPPKGHSQTTVKSKGRDEYVVGYCRPPIEYQFKPGQGGRRKGARNKLGEDFIQALADDFERHGAEVIERVRVQSPAVYLRVVASLLPRDVNLSVSSLDSLTDDCKAADISGRVAEERRVRLENITCSL